MTSSIFRSMHFCSGHFLLHYSMNFETFLASLHSFCIVICSCLPEYFTPRSKCLLIEAADRNCLGLDLRLGDLAAQKSAAENYSMWKSRGFFVIKPGFFEEVEEVEKIFLFPQLFGYFLLLLFCVLVFSRLFFLIIYNILSFCFISNNSICNYVTMSFCLSTLEFWKIIV